MKLISILFCLFILGCGMFNSPEKAAWKYQLTRLKAPSTAKLISSTAVTSDALKSSDSSFSLVTLVYDSQNSFGAMIRGETKVILYLDKAKGEWIPDHVTDK